MRILDVTPKRVFPPISGAMTRIQILMRHLAREHEVEQFALPWHEPWPSRVSISVAEPFPGYREHVWRHPVAWLASEVGRRSWVTAPVPAGAALRALRPAVLDRLLAWADVVLVEQPWLFEYCRRRARGA